MHRSDKASLEQYVSGSSAPPDRLASNAVTHRYDICTHQVASYVS